MEAIEADGLDAAEERLFESHDDGPTDDGDARMSVIDAVSRMPYDFSPARKRCLELTARLLGQQQDAPNGS